MGAATAEALAREGAAVLVADLNREGVMVDRAVTAFGKLDLAANVAGVPQEPTPLTETTLELWDRTHAVNDRGLFLSLQAEVPAILAAGGGAIVNVASLNGLRAFSQMIAYGSSKFGAVSTTLTTASEFASQGIRINGDRARLDRHADARNPATRDPRGVRLHPADAASRPARRDRERDHLPPLR